MRTNQLKKRDLILSLSKDVAKIPCISAACSLSRADKIKKLIIKAASRA
jgi:hypothetical protein